MKKQFQEPIQALLDQFVADGTERGVQVAAYLNGELVVDAVAGVADPATGRKVTSETLFPIFSTGKGMAATLAHLMVERGKITYDTPIAKVWPEFAANGKGGITLRHALSHTAGLQNMPADVTHADLGDWDTMCRKMAAATPTSAPGAVYAYHAITYSWLVGETTCRVDGRKFQQLLHDEISAPLGMEKELFSGIPDEAEPRVAILEAKEESSEPLPHAATDLAVPPLVQPLHVWMNRPDARRTCIPASTGIMTARAMAKHYAALLPGGVDGVEILPPERIRLATEPQPRPTSLGPDEPLPGHRLGYAIGSPFSPTSFGHGGAGGSLAIADPEHNLAFGFTRNRFVDETSLIKVCLVLKKAMGI
jgi:CubicO group peptidase (beta-lactamase class C family)